MYFSLPKLLWAFIKQPSNLIQRLAQQDTPRSCPSVFLPSQINVGFLKISIIFHTMASPRE